MGSRFGCVQYGLSIGGARGIRWDGLASWLAVSLCIVTSIWMTDRTMQCQKASSEEHDTTEARLHFNGVAYWAQSRDEVRTWAPGLGTILLGTTIVTLYPQLHLGCIDIEMLNPEVMIYTWYKHRSSIGHALGGTFLCEDNVCVGPPLRMRIMPLSLPRKKPESQRIFCGCLMLVLHVPFHPLWW